MTDYILTAQKKSDILAVLSGGKGIWTFEMAIDRLSIKTKVDAASNTGTVSLTDREIKTMCDALRSARVSANATEDELNRYSALCVDFSSL